MILDTTMADDDDKWRDTLFIWDGILTIDDKEAHWKGKWVGVENCPDAKEADMPKRGFGEHIPSDMEFEVSGTTVALESEDGKEPYKVSFVKGEGWDLLEEGSKEKHKDTEHEVYLPNLKWTGNLDQRNNLVYAMGNNESGAFIAVGWMRPGNRLTLGRRYLGEKDARIKWGVDELREAVLEEIYLEEDDKVTIPPWQCAALHSDVLPSKKKQKVDDAKSE